MNWQGLQVGKKKAVNRCPWMRSKWWSGDAEYALGLHRKTTKLCSAAIHGCGHVREMKGPTRQEIIADQNFREQIAA